MYNITGHTRSWDCAGTGGTLGQSGSTQSCTASEQRCGDGIQNGAEACDDGANGDATDGCNDSCELTTNGQCGGLS